MVYAVRSLRALCTHCQVGHITRVSSAYGKDWYSCYMKYFVSVTMLLLVTSFSVSSVSPLGLEEERQLVAVVLELGVHNAHGQRSLKHLGAAHLQHTLLVPQLVLHHLYLLFVGWYLLGGTRVSLAYARGGGGAAASKACVGFGCASEYRWHRYFASDSRKEGRRDVLHVELGLQHATICNI